MLGCWCDGCDGGRGFFWLRPLAKDREQASAVHPCRCQSVVDLVIVPEDDLAHALEPIHGKAATRRNPAWEGPGVPDNIRHGVCALNGELAVLTQSKPSPILNEIGILQQPLLRQHGLEVVHTVSEADDITEGIDHFDREQSATAHQYVGRVRVGWLDLILALRFRDADPRLGVPQMGVHDGRGPFQAASKLPTDGFDSTEISL